MSIKYEYPRDRLFLLVGRPRNAERDVGRLKEMTMYLGRRKVPDAAKLE